MRFGKNQKKKMYKDTPFFQVKCLKDRGTQFLLRLVLETFRVQLFNFFTKAVNMESTPLSLTAQQSGAVL